MRSQVLYQAAQHISFKTQHQTVPWSLLADKHIDSQEVEYRLEQCIRGDAEAPSLALYPKGPALLRVVQTQDQLVAPPVARKLCPDHQDLKAVMLPSFARPHPTFTDSLRECELKLVMRQLAVSLDFKMQRHAMIQALQQQTLGC